MATGTMITLFEQYSSLREKLPYVQLGEFPTPILRLNQLGKDVGAAQLYLKNDGVSGLEYGGNKIRKLEFILENNMRSLAF
jgi:1-aminocyclopropane-1-carboxylate deaminase/D-cysteine desulfhydrase-like pyridoxal-dependent ACC family enzyme